MATKPGKTGEKAAITAKKSESSKHLRTSKPKTATVKNDKPAARK